MEVSEPRIRSTDFAPLVERIKTDSDEKIEVSELKVTDRARAQQLKADAESNVKEYHALIATEVEVDGPVLERAMEQLHGIEISQRTPNRVKHRRSDLVRTKHIYEVHLEKIEPCLLEGTFKVQGGTYVKELISGDEQRTTPSLTELLGTPCICSQLNVTAIHS